VSPAAGSTLSLLLAAPATENGTPADGGDGAKGRASPPWQPSSDAPAGAAAIGSENKSSSPSSDRSSMPGASDSSFCVASKRSEPNGRSSAPPTTCSSSPRPQREDMRPRSCHNKSPERGSSLLLSQAPRPCALCLLPDKRALCGSSFCRRRARTMSGVLEHSFAWLIVDLCVVGVVLGS